MAGKFRCFLNITFKKMALKNSNSKYKKQTVNDKIQGQASILKLAIQIESLSY